MGAIGISFRRPQHKFFTALWNAPKRSVELTSKARNRGYGAGREDVSCETDFLLGLSCDVF